MEKIFLYLAIFYLPVILNWLKSLLIKEGKAVFAPKKVASFLGAIEYLLGPIRDTLLSPLLIILSLWSLFTQKAIEALLIALVYLALSLRQRRYRKNLQIQLAQVAATADSIHPQDFFRLYYQQLSPWPPSLATQGLRTLPLNEQDYRDSKKPKWTLLPVLKATLNTASLARMAIQAFKKLGPSVGREAFDALARLWGSRTAELLKIKPQTQLPANFNPLSGKVLLVYNHVSTLDFCLNFAALAPVKVQNPEDPQPRHLRPRFIAAKDHFIDNPFVYSWVGLGKVIEDAGMIFINRRKKGQGWAAMQEAAEKLCQTPVEIAVYPQGTRAHPMQKFNGEPWDAGYYTTFHPKHWDKALGHLKEGTAQLILDTLIELGKEGQNTLTVLTTGIHGVGNALPKGRFKIRTQAEITYQVGEPWVLQSQDFVGLEKPHGREAITEAQKKYQSAFEKIQAELNKRMLQALNWHAELVERARLVLHDLEFSPQEQEAFKRLTEKAKEQKESLIFILLDRLLSLPPPLWKRFFQLIFGLKEKDFSDPAWKALLQEVSERVIQKSL